MGCAAVTIFAAKTAAEQRRGLQLEFFGPAPLQLDHLREIGRQGEGGGCTMIEGEGVGA